MMKRFSMVALAVSLMLVLAGCSSGPARPSSPKKGSGPVRLSSPQKAAAVSAVRAAGITDRVLMQEGVGYPKGTTLVVKEESEFQDYPMTLAEAGKGDKTRAEQIRTAYREKAGKVLSDGVLVVSVVVDIPGYDESTGEEWALLGFDVVLDGETAWLAPQGVAAAKTLLETP